MIDDISSLVDLAVQLSAKRDRRIMLLSSNVRANCETRSIIGVKELPSHVRYEAVKGLIRNIRSDSLVYNRVIEPGIKHPYDSPIGSFKLDYALFCDISKYDFDSIMQICTRVARCAYFYKGCIQELRFSWMPR